MSSNEMIAAGMVEHRETPRIPQSDQMRLSREEVDVQHSKIRDLVAKPIYFGVLLRVENWKRWSDRARSGRRRCCLTGYPDQEAPPVSPLLKIGHEAVDYVRERRQDVQRVHVRVGDPPVLDLLDVCPFSAAFSTGRRRLLTGDIVVQDIVFLDGIIEQFPAAFVHHQDFPLREAG